MMTLLPVSPRARWTASMVDSVPELVKRQCGSPQRRRSSSATVIEPSVGAAKWVPASMRAFTAAAITGFAWPTHITPKPLWKSRYSLPSTSHTRAPSPRSRYTGHGSLFWNCEGTPPGMTAEARWKYSPERRVRSTRLAFSRSVSMATRAGSMAVSASVRVMPPTLLAHGVRLSRLLPERGAADLAAGGARELGGELDDPRVLVRRRLRLDVLLQRRRQRGGRREAVAQHDDGAHDAAALLVGRGDDRGIGDRRMAPERALDLHGPDPVAGRDDHVVRAALEEEEAVRVGAHAVAGPPRTHVRLLAQVAQEEGGIGRGIGQDELAGVDRERDAGQRAAHRPAAGRLPRRHPRELAGLRLAVAVADPQPGRVVPRRQHAGVERLARGHEHPQSGRRPRRGALGDHPVLRRRHAEHVHALARQHLQPLVRIEARVVQQRGRALQPWGDERVARRLRPARGRGAPHEVALARREPVPGLQPLAA